MYLLLFAVYLILFSWLVTRIRFFTQSGLPPVVLIAAFLLKVTVGAFYGWVGTYTNQLDTWAFHGESIKEKTLLLKDPVEFIASLFRNGYASNIGDQFLSVENSWWNDLDANFFIKMLGVFNVFSFDHYYINVIFYSFLTFAGPIAIYRVMSDLFPTKKAIVFLSTFLLPSFIYWTSGIHKDGLIFMSLALILYCFHFALPQNNFSFRRLIVIASCLFLLLVLRNFLVPILIPALASWVFARNNKRPFWTFAVVYALCVLLFFTAKYIHPGFDFPQSLVKRQQAFLSLKGESGVAVEYLQAHVGSFIRNAPQAFLLSCTRPYPSDVRHIYSLAAFIEINLILIFLLLFIFFREPGIRISPVLLFCLFFSFSVLMSIGYTVHFTGAIVRYRSIVLPFLIVPLTASIDWKKILQWRQMIL